MDKPDPPVTRTMRQCTESTMRLHDDTEIFFRAWSPAKEAPKPSTAVVLFHRGHEHSGRFLDVVDRLGIDESWVFAWDQRGHGCSPGKRGVADSVSQLARDANDFVNQLSENYEIPIANMAVIGHSIGAVVVSTWIHDYSPPICGLLLVTPAFRVKLYVPAAIPGLRLLKKICPNAMVKSYVRPSMLTHDTQAANTYAADPLLSPAVSVNLLLDLHDTSTRLMTDAGAIHCPVAIHVAGRDWVVRPSAQKTFFSRLSSTTKEIHIHDEMYHDVLHEQNRDQALNSIGNFVRARLGEKPVQPNLFLADKTGPSCETWKQYRDPLPFYHPRRWYFRAMRFVLGTAGRRISSGIKLGWDEGFNSGRMLDYIYLDKAHGFTPLGKLADRIFLDSPGWKGIRKRRHHMNDLLDRAIENIAASRTDPKESIHILDIAAGGGRYALDAIQRNSNRPLTATLCDQDSSALQHCEKIAIERGIKGVNFQQSDAFDRSAIANFKPRPDIVIVSGLYELFPENSPVMESLQGIADVIAPEGCLIYTNQPWHPQQELIARSLHGYDGQLWAMRCRSSAEIDYLVAQVGFRKQQMKIDEQGIFTVSLARMNQHASQ